MNSIKSFAGICLLFVFISSIPLNAQNKPTSEQIKAQRDSLLAYKAKLKQFIEATKTEIEELRKERDYLDEKVKKEFEKLYVLKYGEEDGMRIAHGRIWKGMTEEMLKDSWGKHDKKNTEKFNYGVFTQYDYGDITFFFRDGVLIDWEDKGKNK